MLLIVDVRIKIPFIYSFTVKILFLRINFLIKHQIDV